MPLKLIPLLYNLVILVYRHCEDKISNMRQLDICKSYSNMRVLCKFIDVLQNLYIISIKVVDISVHYVDEMGDAELDY